MDIVLICGTCRQWKLLGPCNRRDDGSLKALSTMTNLQEMRCCLPPISSFQHQSITASPLLFEALRMTILLWGFESCCYCNFGNNRTLCSSAVGANTHSDLIPECKACRTTHGVGSSVNDLLPIIPLAPILVARPMLSKITPRFRWQLSWRRISNSRALRPAL